jgi:hypothetical protein
MRPAPNPEDQVPVFMSPSDSVAQLYIGTGFTFFAFCVSKGYGGGILTHFHTDILSLS